MATSMDVANYFLATLGSDPESDLTNLKMQKLCAYGQALSLALLDRPLFDEPLNAWRYGPVIASLYDTFEKYENRPLPADGLSEEYARKPFDDEQKFILELTRSRYGALSAWQLRDKSHTDFPGKFGSKKIIPDQAIKAQFEQKPFIKKLKEYKFSEETDRIYSESEFMDALYS